MAKQPRLAENIVPEKKIRSGVPQEERAIPKPIVKPALTRFTFSLQYFKQIKYFEIGQQQQAWYISLIDRLQELSSKTREVFLRDITEKQNFRYHEIDWNGTNVPIKREDLNWIDTAYLYNKEEYPFVQFHISLALGRVVGFWDENHVFQIVLLDPLHNIQPSKRYAYKVDDTHFMSSQISSLLVDIQKIKAKIKEGCSCETCLEIKKIPTKINMTNLLIAHLDDSYLEKIESSTLHIEQILELGLLSIEE